MLVVSPRLFLEWFINDFFKMIFISMIFAITSIFYALSIPNQYSSQVVVSSNMSGSKSMGGSLSKIGGLASLAGISLGGDGTLSSEVLYEMLNSSSFLASFIRKHGLEKETIAVEGYNPESDNFIYKAKIYDVKNNVWVRDFKFPKTLEPNDFELVEKFKESFNANYARKTKLIKVSFKSFSPQYSVKILNDLIFHFNEYMRNNDIEEFESSIKYLKQELTTSSYEEVNLSLQQLMEEQYKKLAIAKVRGEYALRIIEAPLLAANKSEPKRAIICAVITVCSTILTVFLWWVIRIIRLS
jgi:uncharacterized protein involved in exopolysaccharide biosynthesis